MGRDSLSSINTRGVGDTERATTHLRESPSLKLLELLTARGAVLDYNDPYFAALHKMRHYDFSNRRSVNLSPDRVEAAIAS